MAFAWSNCQGKTTSLAAVAPAIVNSANAKSGPLLPPDPWESTIASGPLLPPDPWESIVA
jgi:hypothetical protein